MRWKEANRMSLAMWSVTFKVPFEVLHLLLELDTGFELLSDLDRDGANANCCLKYIIRFTQLDICCCGYRLVKVRLA